MGNKDSLPQEIEVQQERQKQRKETPSYKPASIGTINKDSPSQTKKNLPCTHQPAKKAYVLPC